jgi:hypothetical protein
MASAELLRAIGLAQNHANSVSRVFNPDQPRVPAGSGPESGRWTNGSVAEDAAAGDPPSPNSRSSRSPDDVARPIRVAVSEEEEDPEEREEPLDPQAPGLYERLEADMWENGHKDVFAGISVFGTARWGSDLRNRHAIRSRKSTAKSLQVCERNGVSRVRPWCKFYGNIRIWNYKSKAFSIHRSQLDSDTNMSFSTPGESFGSQKICLAPIRTKFMTNDSLRYSATHYLTRNMKPDDGITVFDEKPRPSVSIGDLTIEIVGDDLLIAEFRFRNDGWCLISTKSIYYMSDSKLLHISANLITRADINVIPRKTRIEDIDEIRLSIANNDNVIIKANTGNALGLLYNTITRLVRRNLLERIESTGGRHSTVEKIEAGQFPRGALGLFRK